MSEVAHYLGYAFGLFCIAAVVGAGLYMGARVVDLLFSWWLKK